MSRVVQLDALPVGEAPEAKAVARPAVIPAKPMAQSARWLGLDLLRFVAVCLMVQGHVFSTLLDSATKAEGWYPHHSFVHGYTAPMFLFGAGLAFGYTTFRKWDEHTRSRAAALKRFKRYGWLLIIGYGLHLPTLSLAGILQIDDPARIARMLQVDVLQHIGVTLAICQALLLVVKNKRVFVAIIGLLGAASVFAAPWIWNIDLSHGPIPVGLAAYVNGSTGSIFPVLPWAGFTTAGIVVAYVVGVGGSATSVSAKVAWPFAVLATAFMLVPIVIDRFGPLPWPAHNFWKTDPLFFFWRLGNVLAVLALLCFVERFLSALGWLGEVPTTWAGRIAQRLLPWVKLIGAESLIIYVAHLVALHGSVLAPGIKHGGWVDESGEGVGVAALITLGMMLAMLLLARVWTELKKQKTGFAVVQLTMVSVIAVLMVTGR